MNILHHEMLSQLLPCIKFITSQRNTAIYFRILVESLEDFPIGTIQSKIIANSYEYHEGCHVSMRP